MAWPRALDHALLCILFLAYTSPTQTQSIERKSSEPDPNTSSGTCYFGPGEEADSSYIPCGNTAFGNVHCCEASTVCLSNNACYEADAGTTYVAGCTDSAYQDPSCPDKGIYSNQQWSGLVYCNGTSNEWTLCDDSSANSNTVVAVPGCWCPVDESSRNFAFSAPSILANQASLPASNGGTMEIYSGYTPSTILTSTTSSTPKTTTTSSLTSSSSTVSLIAATPSAAASSAAVSSDSSSSRTISGPTSFATSPSSEVSSSSSSVSGAGKSSSTSSSGLSTGAKAGIGIGASILGLAALAFIVIAVWFGRRKRQIMLEDKVGKPTMEAQPVENGGSTALPQRNSAWSMNKSELEAGESPSVSALSPRSIEQPWSRPLSEVEGSVPTFQSMASVQSQELDDTSRRAYRKAEVAPNMAQGFAASSTTSHGSYRPGRQVESGVYEMPAHLPGSTLM